MNKLYPYDEEMRACMQNFLRARVTVTADDEEVLRKTAEDATAKFGSRRLKKKESATKHNEACISISHNHMFH